ncbi:FH3 [Symbiodinium necroappetens]|uniref:FH3 protein n=1 Tax=Symbiodinium necroappetens TaxID=1628268 RepID=A0A812V7Q0_9DINO|nr:FH3 [Symbiodinium necroappetens]
MVDTAEGAGTSALVNGGIPVGEHPGVGRCAGTVPVLCPADTPGAQQRAFATGFHESETSGSPSGDRAAMNETDLDRIMAAGPAQQESFSKSPGTRGAPDRKGYSGGKARAGPASHPLHLSAGSGSHSKTAQSFAQTPRLPAKTVYKSWPAMGSPVYNSRTVPGEGDALQDGHDGLHLTSALPKASKGPAFVHPLGSRPPRLLAFFRSTVQSDCDLPDRSCRSHCTACAGASWQEVWP